MSYLAPELPPITLNSVDAERLLHLADITRRRLPGTAEFLTREVERANIVSPQQLLPGVVAMGSEVEFRDETTGQVRRVTLVYPHEADVSANKISVLTPIGSALIGLSVGQSIEWETPLGERRSMTVLKVQPDLGSDSAAVAKPAHA